MREVARASTARDDVSGSTAQPVHFTTKDAGIMLTQYERGVPVLVGSRSTGGNDDGQYHWYAER
jgi:hypothetical protein